LRRRPTHLHGEGAEAKEALGVLLAHLGDMIVEEFRDLQAVLGFGPVRKHDWHCTDDLDVDA
jgi:hypothetical protein